MRFLVLTFARQKSAMVIISTPFSFLHVYESIATVGESRVWWRADFQIGSRVLKKVF